MRHVGAVAESTSRKEWLARVAGFRNTLVITGAGCSVPSGIPAYRSADGRWLHRTPVTYAEFMGSEEVRRRYWARSTSGWLRVQSSEPNAVHRVLARLEHTGFVRVLVTQNVDGLHGRAGSSTVIALHGDLASVTCTRCGRRDERQNFQAELERANPNLDIAESRVAPDGDAALDERVYATFEVPDCRHCGGLIKPDVVFFGEAVPTPRVDTVKRHVANCDAVLVVGSSLTVFSGFRFVKLAAARALPIAVLNRGSTRADALGALHLDAEAQDVLPELESMVNR